MSQLVNSARLIEKHNAEKEKLKKNEHFPRKDNAHFPQRAKSKFVAVVDQDFDEEETSEKAKASVVNLVELKPQLFCVYLDFRAWKRKFPSFQKRFMTLILRK